MIKITSGSINFLKSICSWLFLSISQIIRLAHISKSSQISQKLINKIEINNKIPNIQAIALVFNLLCCGRHLKHKSTIRFAPKNKPRDWTVPTGLNPILLLKSHGKIGPVKH